MSTACHSNQRDAAEYLVHQGADINWVAPWDALTPLDAARRSEPDDVATWDDVATGLVSHGCAPVRRTCHR